MEVKSFPRYFRNSVSCIYRAGYSKCWYLSSVLKISADTRVKRMAEAAVSFFLDNVSQLLARETGLIGGVKDQILSLHCELNLMNQFLKN